MPEKVKALVVDDELAVLESFKLILGIKDYEVTTAQNQAEAEAAVKKDAYDIAFIDLRFYGRDEGLNILKRLKELSPKTEAVIVTAYASEASKMGAIQLGALDYISKPFMMEIIYELVDRVLLKRKRK